VFCSPRMLGLLARVLFFFAVVPRVFARDGLDARIQQMAQSWVEQGQTVGVVVGVVTAQGKKIYGAGSTSRGSGKRPDGSTLFEIGSITKVFTNLLLVDEVARGRVTLNDPVTQYLPSSFRFPTRKRPWYLGFLPHPPNKPVCLVHLALHTSGFPFIVRPSDLPKDWKVTEPDYITLDMLRDFFNRFSFDRDPGERFEYSVINTGLLALVLTFRERKEYEILLKERVLDPLGLEDTRVRLSEEQSGRMAQGYGSNGRALPTIHITETTAGSCGLKSTATDLTRFMDFQLGLRPCALKNELKEETRPLIMVNSKEGRTLGYDYRQFENGTLIYQDARTMGFRGILALVPDWGVGVVILGNSESFDAQKKIESIVQMVLREQLHRTPLSRF